MHKTLNTIVNRGVFGALYAILVGIVSAVALGVLGVSLSGTLADLGTGISTGNILMIVLWAVTVLILASLAIVLTKHSHAFKILGRKTKEDEQIHLPKKYSIFGLLALGALISTALFVLEWFASSLGGTTNITGIAQAWEDGSILGIVGSALAIIAVGYVVFAITSRYESLQKLVKKSEFTNKVAGKEI